ncbi:ABC transporter periplasmic binding domain [Syntrophomonas zehnderi OL-4]|uniref:ABC transporter periplasmic binding domain n=1 Tax=Syntrophomonas zehnderi OL-4 TaxID=690567 RepID=A0A0E4GD93_9FIRM|nr:ABC transporter substrate-binding protein [Syntrophomonas zehnderi]CFX39748.1 ABC transporter periplasmic binding domain [Syntrophomonas zehnderi OL-4]
MKTQRKNISLIIILNLLLALSGLTAGCSNEHKADQPAKVSEPSKTITITDCIGRNVTIPAHPQRIACLCPESGHALALFGQGDKIVAGVGGMQRDLLLVEMYPHIKKVPVPKNSGVINIEELAKCEPDIAFVKSDTAHNQAEVDKMNKSGIPFLVIEFNNMKEQQAAMTMIAKALGTANQAQKYNQYYQRCLERVEEKIAAIPEKDRIRVYHSVNEATRTVTRGTLPADWIQAAGAKNVALDQELKLFEGKYYASLEQILLWDPEYILVNDPNVVEYIMNHEHWRSLQAVKSMRVLALPNGISRWGHFSSLETPLAVIWTAQTLYPDKFTDIDMVVETKYFYKEFFRLDLNDATVQKILSSEGMRVSKN